MKRLIAGFLAFFTVTSAFSCVAYGEGAENTGKFCSECGSPKPSEKKVFSCSTCGWTTFDVNNLPKFCPECGERIK